ncbi:uncharacterized protein LOC103092112 [Monodelphis domestica]|uniref:uncharacterized protein LOC103092112 n=1 Tax=Monodelphis domestica TaxID=13616 RepID=UPI00028BD4BE|nr:uncharacterized protein LOC103092112 [Monodelphis domestica]
MAEPRQRSIRRAKLAPSEMDSEANSKQCSGVRGRPGGHERGPKSTAGEEGRGGPGAPPSFPLRRTLFRPGERTKMAAPSPEPRRSWPPRRPPRSRAQVWLQRGRSSGSPSSFSPLGTGRFSAGVAFGLIHALSSPQAHPQPFPRKPGTEGRPSPGHSGSWRPLDEPPIHSEWGGPLGASPAPWCWLGVELRLWRGGPAWGPELLWPGRPARVPQMELWLAEIGEKGGQPELAHRPWRALQRLPLVGQTAGLVLGSGTVSRSRTSLREETTAALSKDACSLGRKSLLLPASPKRGRCAIGLVRAVCRGCVGRRPAPARCQELRGRKKEVGPGHGGWRGHGRVRSPLPKPDGPLHTGEAILATEEQSSHKRSLGVRGRWAGPERGAEAGSSHSQRGHGHPGCWL